MYHGTPMNRLTKELNPQFFWGWINGLGYLDGALGDSEDDFFWAYCGASRGYA